MPYLVIDRMEYGPPELGGLLPLRCELVRMMPGADRSDYGLLRPDTGPLYVPQPQTALSPEQEEYYRRNIYPRLESFDPRQVGADLLRTLPDGRIAVAVPGFVATPRFPGTHVTSESRDLWLNLGFVIDSTLLVGQSVDFGKLFFAAVVRVNPVPEPAVPQSAAPPTGAAPAGIAPAVDGPVRYVDLADRRGNRVGFIWAGLTDERAGTLLPDLADPATVEIATAWMARLRDGIRAGSAPTAIMAGLVEDATDVLSGDVVPLGIADSQSAAALAEAARPVLVDHDRRHAALIPYGVPPQEASTLMVATPPERARIDQLLADGIRARDSVPPDQRVPNLNPKYNKQFGPVVPENEITPDDVARYQDSMGV